MSEAGRPYPPEGMTPLGPPAWPPPSPPARPRRPRWWLPVLVVGVVAVAIGAVVAVAQLAGDDDDGDAAPPRRATTVPAERAPRTTPDAPARTAPPDPGDGTAFTDPQGTYTITLGPAWTEMPSLTAEIETWAVADAADGFTPNVNVLTQDTPGIDQDEYMELSVQSLESIDGELIDQSFVTGANGNALGLIEYTARSPGVDVELHLIGVFEVRDGTAIVGTFTAPPGRFDELWSSVEPYLMTLQTTG